MKRRSFLGATIGSLFGGLFVGRQPPAKGADTKPPTKRVNGLGVRFGAVNLGPVLRVTATAVNTVIIEVEGTAAGILMGDHHFGDTAPLTVDGFTFGRTRIVGVSLDGTLDGPMWSRITFQVLDEKHSEDADMRLRLYRKMLRFQMSPREILRLEDLTCNDVAFSKDWRGCSVGAWGWRGRRRVAR